jgi:hypothetical protein
VDEERRNGELFRRQRAVARFALAQYVYESTFSGRLSVGCCFHHEELPCSLDFFDSDHRLGPQMRELACVMRTYRKVVAYLPLKDSVRDKRVGKHNTVKKSVQKKWSKFYEKHREYHYADVASLFRATKLPLLDCLSRVCCASSRGIDKDVFCSQLVALLYHKLDILDIEIATGKVSELLLLWMTITCSLLLTFTARNVHVQRSICNWLRARRERQVRDAFCAQEAREARAIEAQAQNSHKRETRRIGERQRRS